MVSVLSIERVELDIGLNMAAIDRAKYLTRRLATDRGHALGKFKPNMVGEYKKRADWTAVCRGCGMSFTVKNVPAPANTSPGSRTGIIPTAVHQQCTPLS